VEFGFRALTAAFWPAFTSAAIRRSMAPLRELAAETRGDTAQGTRARETIHPYLGFVTTPGIRMEEQSYPVTRSRLDRQVGPGVEPWWLPLRANNWGFLSPHLMPYQKKPDDFVVVVLGGSVGMWLALQGEETLRGELERRTPLAGKNVVILNYAMNGFKQPQQVMTLAYLLGHGTRPDVVLEVDGFNDAAIAYHNLLSSVSTDYPRADLWPFLVSELGYSSRVLALLAAQFREKETAASLAGQATRWSGASNVVAFLFMRSALQSQAREQVLHAELQHAQSEDIPAYRRFAARGPTSASPEEDRLDEIVRVWVEGSEMLFSISKGRGIPYLHVLQPTLQDVVPRPSKPLSPEEQEIAATQIGTWAAWAEGVKKLYPRMRERADALREGGVAFEDLSYLFASTPGTIYYDICHYNQRGNEMLARAIVQRLARELDGG